jgi:hypothetical protein
MIVRLTYPVGWHTLASRGLGQVGGDFVSSLASAIQQMEGWYPGSLAYRNNNPGNLRPGLLAVGATGSSGGYAVFPNYQTGWNALLGLIQSPGYWNLTLTQFFAKYAPGADNNNPAAYAASVAATLGVDANTPISQLASGGGAVAAAAAPPDNSGDGGSGTIDTGDAAGSPDTSSDTSDSSSVSPLALGIGVGAILLAALVL